MNSRKKWLISFTLTLVITIIAAGAGIIFRMDASFLRNQNTELKDELQQRLSDLQAAADNTSALEKQISELKDKLQTAREELDSMDEEMRSQKQRLGLDYQEQVARERRKFRELKEINNQQKNGNRPSPVIIPWSQRLEAMKTEDPERYRQIMEAKARSEKRMKEQQQRREDLLAELENSELTPEKQATLNRFRDLTDKMLALKEKLQDAPPEESRQLWIDNRQNFKELSNLTQNISEELFNKAVKEGKADTAREILELFPSRYRPTKGKFARKR